MTKYKQSIDLANSLIRQVKLAAMHDSAIPEWLEQELFDILVIGYEVGAEEKGVGQEEMGDQDSGLPSDYNIDREE